MNIPELKKAMEMAKRVLEDDQSGCGCSYESDAGKAIDTLLSTCQLLCDVSDKMEPKKEHFALLKISQGDPKMELKECRTVDDWIKYGYNLARSEDILWLTKKMMGLEDIVAKVLFSGCQLSYKDAEKKVANAIRQEMGI